MVIKKLVLGILHTNCYFIVNNGQCIIIDPATDASRIIEYAKSLNAEIKAVILTHGHFDHVGACANLQKNGIKIYVSRIDGEVLKENPVLLGLRKNMFFVPDYYLDDGDEINLIGLNIKCILTSGHTEGSMSYLIEDNLFCGDTIFAGGIYGRCDLYSGNYEKIKHSIKDVIFSLDENISLFCGHGKESVIKWEKFMLSYL